jgi:hypothetical protein
LFLKISFLPFLCFFLAGSSWAQQVGFSQSENDKFFTPEQEIALEEDQSLAREQKGAIEEEELATRKHKIPSEKKEFLTRRQKMIFLF